MTQVLRPAIVKSLQIAFLLANILGELFPALQLEIFRP